MTVETGDWSRSTDLHLLREEILDPVETQTWRTVYSIDKSVETGNREFSSTQTVQ
ncbi:MAG: hypothetical protein ACFFAJ_05070 [Candidatus Hodarchaeota archaeon]